MHLAAVLDWLARYVVAWDSGPEARTVLRPGAMQWAVAGEPIQRPPAPVPRLSHSWGDLLPPLPAGLAAAGKGGDDFGLIGHRKRAASS